MNRMNLAFGLVTTLAALLSADSRGAAQVSRQGEQVEVYVQPNRRITVKVAEVIEAADIAFDANRNLLWILRPSNGSANSFTVTEIDRTGDVRRVRKLPRDLRPITGVYGLNGKIEIIAGHYEPRDRNSFLIPSLPDKVARIRLEPDSDECSVEYLPAQWSVDDDTNLNPGSAGVIRQLLREANYLTEPVPGMHVGIETSHPEHVFINARPLGNDWVEYNPDLSVVYFGWGSFQHAVIAKRTLDGKHRSWPVEDMINRAHRRAEGNQAILRCNGVALSDGEAVLGATTTLRGHTDYIAIKLDVAGDSPRVTRIAPGRVARQMKQFTRSEP
jgi:hypothetical protein